MKFLRCAAMIAISVLLLTGCQGTDGEMQDGYYTAESAAYDDAGWKDFLTIYVSDNKIVTVEFNAYNRFGFVRSWDSYYQRKEKRDTGLHPSAYLRTYTSELLNLQNPEKVLVVAGAESPHKAFQLLAAEAIVQAKAGDKRVALVELT